MNLGDKILDLRKKKQMTQEELAAELGVTAAAVSKWEKNYTLPDVMMLGALADYFHVSVDELMGRREYLKKIFIVAKSKHFAVKLERLSGQYGFVLAEYCETYQEAVCKAIGLGEECYILVSSDKQLSEAEMGEHKGIHVIQSVCESEEETLRMLEIMFRGLK